MTFDPGLTNRVADSVGGMRVAVLVDARAVHKIGLAVHAHRQVTAVTVEVEVALAARRLNEPARLLGRVLLRAASGSRPAITASTTPVPP